MQENALLHQPHPSRFRESENCRHSGSRAEAQLAGALKNTRSVTLSCVYRKTSSGSLNLDYRHIIEVAW